jgi:hypothetical protein
MAKVLLRWRENSLEKDCKRLDEDDDMLTSMAKELAERNGKWYWRICGRILEAAQC